MLTVVFSVENKKASAVERFVTAHNINPDHPFVATREKSDGETVLEGLSHDPKAVIVGEEAVMEALKEYYAQVRAGG